MIRHVRSLFALICTLALVGCAELDSPAPELQHPDSVETVEAPIQGGEVEDLNTAVVGLTLFGFSTCSGTLIAPNLVLTAQHCLSQSATENGVICGQSEFGFQVEPRWMQVSTQTQLRSDPSNTVGREIHVPPGANDLCGYDMALIILEDNIAREDADYIIPRIDLNVTPGEKYTATGYGHTGDGSGSGTRRTLTDRTIECVGSEECGFRLGGQITDTEWYGSGGTCQGDSGGPALDEDNQVIGVVSRGQQPCLDTVYTSVYEWGDWILEIGERAAELGGYADNPPPWIATGSSSPRLVDADYDGVRDWRDNCVDTDNLDQADSDGDGLGDVCDPVDGNDRGGNCTVCNSCDSNADCGDGGRCVVFGASGFCTLACETDADCPADTTCFNTTDAFGEDRSVCLNPNSGDAGICEANYVCNEEETVEPDPDGSGEGSGDGNDDDGGAGGGGGCSTSSRPNGSIPAALLLVGAMLGLMRRRSR